MLYSLLSKNAVCHDRKSEKLLESSSIRITLFSTTFPSYHSFALQTCHIHIRDLRRLRPIHCYKTACTIAISIIANSSLDYSNFLFYHIDISQIKRLKTVQNAPTRIPKPQHLYVYLCNSCSQNDHKKFRRASIIKSMPFKPIHHEISEPSDIRQPPDSTLLDHHHIFLYFGLQSHLLLNSATAL